MPIYRPPRQKPQIGAIINHEHPLSKRLISAWVFNEKDKTTISDKTSYRNTASLPESGASWFADFMRIVRPSGIILGNPNGLFSFGSDDFLLTVRFAKQEASSSWTNTFLVSKWDVSSSGDNNAYTLNVTTTGSNNKFIGTIRKSGAEVSVTGPDITVGNTYTASFGRQADLLVLWIDGVQAATQPGAAGAITDAANYNLYLSRSARAIGELSADIHYFYVHRGLVSNPEIAWLHAEPYAMFEQSRRVRYFIPAAAAAIIVPFLWQYRNRRM